MRNQETYVTLVLICMRNQETYATLVLISLQQTWRVCMGHPYVKINTHLSVAHLSLAASCRISLLSLSDSWASSRLLRLGLSARSTLAVPAVPPTPPEECMGHTWGVHGMCVECAWGTMRHTWGAHRS